MYVYMYVCMYACMYVCMYVCLYVYMYMCVCQYNIATLYNIEHFMPNTSWCHRPCVCSHSECFSRSHSFKAVLLGYGHVGKTSLVLRYVENKSNDKHIFISILLYVFVM